MSGFVDDMARSSAARVAEAIRHESASALERRARRAAPSNPLRLSASGVDVIAELKLRSPAAGRLGGESEDWLGRLPPYEPVGAAARAVLSRAVRFAGALGHLGQNPAALRPLSLLAARN